MQLSVEMFHAEDLAALAIIAQALNMVRRQRPFVPDRAHELIGECLTGAVYANQLVEHFRSRQKYFEAGLPPEG